MDTKDKKDLQKKLAKYSTLAIAITAVGDANAGIIYTDEAPDFNGVIGSQYFLDLNNDGNDDFRIWHNGSSNLYISPLTSSNEVLGSGGATFAYPFALSSGAMISSGAGSFFNNGYSGGFQSLNYGSCSFGNWCNVTDRFIGLRFSIGGNIHYGWVRLDVNNAGSVWTVKDYAYDDVMGTGIPAGSMGTPGTASPSSGIIGTDISDNANSTDLEVMFTASSDETTVSEYRIVAVSAASTPGFNQAVADALPAANYTAVTPNASPTYTQIFSAGALDSDGVAIVQGAPYSMFILNVADGVNATTNSLSTGNVVTLHIPADTAQTIVSSDVSDIGPSTDFEVDFTAAANEVGISEYRVIAVKTSSMGGFNLAAAQALPASAYVAITPTGGPYNTSLAGTTDSDGATIINGVSYETFVLSVADGTNATLDALNNSSSSLILTSTLSVSPSITGLDVDETNNGTDLQVNFDAAPSEIDLDEYRVLVVKTAGATGYTLADALSQTISTYTAVTPTGAGSYTVNLPVFGYDTDFDLITFNNSYTIFVASVNTSNPAVTSALSAASPAVMINTTAESGSSVTGLDIGDTGNGAEIQVDFDMANDESKTDEYRVMIVKSASAGSFNLAAAQAVGSADYTVVAPNGSASYSTILGTTVSDVDGDPLTAGSSYVAFVMATNNVVSSNLDSLSDASSAFNMTLLNLEDNVLTSINAYGTNNEVIVELPNNLIGKGINAQLYTLQGRLISSTTLNDARNSLTIDGLSEGIYVFQLNDNSGNKHVIRLKL